MTTTARFATITIVERKLPEDEMKKAFDESLLSIDINNLDEELTNQPATFVHYALKAAQKKSATEKAKLIKETTERKLYIQFRDAAQTSGEKVTEATLDARVKTSDEYQLACAAHSAQQEQYFLFDAITEAYRQRKDMLIAAAANMRAERDTDINIKKKH